MSHTFENELEVMCRVKFSFSPGQVQTRDQEGIPNECEDVELEVLPFYDQAKDKQEYIIDQCFEWVETERLRRKGEKAEQEEQ